MALLLAGSVALFLVGLWGSRNAYHLVPTSLDPVERAHRSRVLRRGALGCLVAAAMFLIAAIAAVRP